ncbi:MAG: fasciclin domain-containing protein [Clostridia bacterium]|nr:fasciclin domain-containing protein [Clostridia bacterium]
MKKVVSLIMAVMLLMVAIPTSAAEGDIVDIASNDSSFSILVTALQTAELVEALQGEGPFTVFAPTDEAFASLLEALDITAEELLSQSGLADVLLYHVVQGKVMSTDLTDEMMAETLNGESIKVDLSDGVKINESTVTTADIEATNGVIHVIDTVLIPEGFTLDMEEEMSIVDIALADENFSTLVAALQQADLVSALQGEGPFTVFAPTNDAFAALLEALDISAEQLLLQPDLAEVLLYHVVGGKVMSTDLTDGLTAETLNGESVTFDLDDGVKVNMSTVIGADVEASNGVIHVIDTVLVPEGFTLQEVEHDTEIPKTGVAGILPFALIGAAGIAGLLFSKKK